MVSAAVLYQNLLNAAAKYCSLTRTKDSKQTEPSTAAYGEVVTRLVRWFANLPLTVVAAHSLLIGLVFSSTEAIDRHVQEEIALGGSGTGATVALEPELVMTKRGS